jgi:hypothetical protein
MTLRRSARCAAAASGLLAPLLGVSLALVPGVPARAQIAFDDATASHHTLGLWAPPGRLGWRRGPDLWAGNHNHWPPGPHNRADGICDDVFSPAGRIR